MADAVLKCLNVIRNQFSGSTDTDELFTYVKEILPIPNENYKVVSVKGTSERFKAEVQCKLESVAAAEIFVNKYVSSNKETLRKLTPKIPSVKSPYSIILYYRCQHKTYHQPSMNPTNVLQQRPSKRLKNTDCPFSMVLPRRQMNKITYLSQYTVDLIVLP